MIGGVMMVGLSAPFMTLSETVTLGDVGQLLSVVLIAAGFGVTAWQVRRARKTAFEQFEMSRRNLSLGYSLSRNDQYRRFWK